MLQRGLCPTVRFRTRALILSCLLFAACGDDPTPATDDGGLADADAGDDADASEDATDDGDPTDDLGDDLGDATNDGGDATTDADAGGGAVTALVLLVTDPLGEALEGVDVEVGDTVVTTGADGLATFDPAPAAPTFVVAARADGLADAYAVVTPTGAEAYEYTLAMPATVSVTVEPGVGATVLPIGGIEVTLPPAGTFVDPSGASYEGAVELRYAELSASVGRTTPLGVGDGAGVATSPAVVASFELSVYGTDGEDAVVLQPGSAVGLRIPFELAAGYEELLAGDDVFLALARFDVESGEWVFEGELAHADGIASATVTHFTRFITYVASRFAGRPPIAVAAEFDTGCACGRVVRGGAPVAGARVTYGFTVPGGGLTVSQSTDVTTGAGGRFCHLTKREGARASLFQPNRPRFFLSGTYPVNDGYQIDGLPVRIDPRPTTDGDPANPSTCLDLGDIPHPVAGPRPTCTANTDCDDGNACTNDVCDTTLAACPGGVPCSGCTSTARTGACDDGDLCTTGETCSTVTPTAANPTGAVCGAGTAVTCGTPSDPCLEGVCSPLTGCGELPVCRHDPNSVCDAGACVCNNWSQPTIPVGGTTAVCTVPTSVAQTCQAIGGLACAGSTTASCVATLGVERTGTGSLCANQYDAVLACLRDNLATAVGCTTRTPEGWELAFPSPCQAELDAWDTCKASPPSTCTVEVRATTGAVASLPPVEALCFAGRDGVRLQGFGGRDDGEALDYLYGGSVDEASVWDAFDAAGGSVFFYVLFGEVAPGPGVPAAAGQGVTMGDVMFIGSAGLGVWEIPDGSEWRLLDFDDATDTFRLQIETGTMRGTSVWPPVGDADGDLPTTESGTATIVVSGRFADFP